MSRESWCSRVSAEGEVLMLFYRVMRWLSWVLLKGFFRFRVVGAELIPLEGPLVVVANHESFLDPFAVGVALRKRPPATFLAAPWIYDKPIAGGFARRVGTVPAYGEGKEVTALRESIRVLQRGGTVALFPQGGIARDGISGGAAFMALKAQAPLLPMRVTGASKALPLKRWWPSLFTRIQVDVRPPIGPADLGSAGTATSEAVARGAELLTEALGLS
jgi:1-acyl-sn-glycerol-3-phosphate acyltransferase